MKLKYLKISLFVLVSLILLNCKSSKKDTTDKKVQESEEYLVFLDKGAAEVQINKDDTDGFFDYMSITDMSIQLKKSDMPESGGESKVLYQDLLRSEMEDFSSDEEKFMEEVFASAKEALDKINPNLLPSRIELIKTKTNHYGRDVYYTREDAIVVPNNIFEEPSIEAQMPIMLHEIFHILSRYNKEFREKMYALIGFESYDEQLVLPKQISDRLLMNPDGVSRRYAINLKDENGKAQLALPLIMSTKDRFEPSMPVFFSYLSFDLFPLIKITNNQVTLGLNKTGGSALSIEHNADFFKQIKDNTQYIIHPDEIMADNFMMAVIANRDESFKGFSEDGTKLLKDVIEILKTFE